MGSMSEPLKQQYIQQFGLDRWAEHAATVEDMWRGIRDKILALSLDYPKVKIYQDGLPLCGKELEIMEDVARLGSHNYNLVRELVKRGAELIGTEEAKLLVEEYNFVKNLTAISDPDERRLAVKKARQRRDELLIERDKFVSGRIAETLREAETGILFSGIEHEIDKYLPPDLKIEYIIYRLPFRRLLADGHG
jgi:hypothetical protein